MESPPRPLSLVGAFVITVALIAGGARAAITFAYLPPDLHDPDPGVLDANLGIAGLTVEDFEDATLACGFTLYINNGATAAALQNGTYQCPAPGETGDFVTRLSSFPDQQWDGAGIIAAQGGTIQFTFDSPISAFGLGLAGWSQGPAGMTFTVNGTTSIGAENVAGDRVDNNLGRNTYLLISASEGDAIASVRLDVNISPSDGIFLDHLAFAAAATCDDGLDNDGDGLCDTAFGVCTDGSSPGDPGCLDASDGTERSAALACDDGLDNDEDGRRDFDPETFADPGSPLGVPGGEGDPVCFSPSFPREFARCQDGIDNDGDGGVDYDAGLSATGVAQAGGADAHCTVPSRNREAAGCGLGFEVSLLVLLLGWGSGRRPRSRSSRSPVDLTG